MKIYLACPYSAPDYLTRTTRFECANRLAGELIGQGHIVFSPISHSNPIANHMNNHLSHECWLAQDKEFIDWCDEVYVLAIPGWEESRGVQWEINYAKKLGKHVVIMEDVCL